MKRIYLELVFFDNTLLDFLLLFLCCRLSEKRVHFPRLLGGAAMGGLYSALALPFPLLASPFIKFPMAALLCLPLGARPFRLYLRRLLLFYLVSFLFGGILFCFMYAQGGRLIGSAQFASLRLLLMGACLLCILVEFLARQSYPREKGHYLLRFCLYGHAFCLDALVDSGNFLRDGAGGGVIVAQRSAIAEGLPPEQFQKLLCPSEARLPVRTFCCHTAAGPAELYAFAPEELTLTANGRRYRLKAYIALGDLSLPGNYRALLSPDLRLHPA